MEHLAENRPDRLRLFVAIKIPADVRSAVAGIQTCLRRELSGAAIRWTKIEQLHLTLKFLGNLDAERVEALADALRTVSIVFAPLRLRAAGIGSFPNLRRPRVLWVGVSDAQGQLEQLQRAIETASREFTTEQPEAGFSGHVTLGRIKHLKRPELAALNQVVASLAEKDFGNWMVNDLELLRSELSSQGAEHSVLKTFALAP